jgi:hypothetical protein
VLLVALVVVLAGCKVDTVVDVKVREDGSGVVRLVVRADAEAVKAAESGGVAIDKAVRLGDLTQAGFRVGAWSKAKDGSATVVISRPFRNVSEVAGIVAALDGKDGPLPRLAATRDHGLIGTDYGVKGRIDLSHLSTGVRSDQLLLQRLQSLGVDVDAIDAQLLAQVQSGFSLKVVVRLPGKAPVTFTPKPGSHAAAVDASTQVVDSERIALYAAAVGFVLLALVLSMRGGRRRRRRTSRAADAPTARGAPARARAAPGARPLPPPDLGPAERGPAPPTPGRAPRRGPRPLPPPDLGPAERGPAPPTPRGGGPPRGPRPLPASDLGPPERGPAPPAPRPVRPGPPPAPPRRRPSGPPPRPGSGS